MIILNIPDTILHVNSKLKDGYSIAKIERELNFGKDTLRKKLNRANYWYDKNLNQFILQDNTDITQSITHTEKTSITQSDNTDLTHKKTQRAFTDEDFNIMFEIIDNYKSKKNNINIPREDSDVTTRSFRSYKSVLDMFAKYCKDNEINQKDAIADALISYMSN